MKTTLRIIRNLEKKNYLRTSKHTPYIAHRLNMSNQIEARVLFQKLVIEACFTNKKIPYIYSSWLYKGITEGETDPKKCRIIDYLNERHTRDTKSRELNRILNLNLVREVYTSTTDTWSKIDITN